MGADTTEKKSGFRLFEKGCGFRAGAKDLLKYTNGSTLSSAIISTIFGCTGPCLVTIAASEAAGFTTAETVSWIFGIYVFGGLLGAIMSLYYKMPISGAFSIPGATLMGTALAGYSFQEAAGAFVIAGVIVLLLGVPGLIGKVMRWLPLPIVMGMIGGCMLKFGTQIVTGINTLPIVCGLAVLAFLLVPRVIKGFPGVLAALVVGVIAAIVTNSFAGEVGELVYTPPMLVVPQFNPNLILSCSLPLAALVVGAENAQAMGVLKAQGYNVVTFAAFGLVGSFTIAFVSFIPSELVNVLAGLAMLNVLIQAFNEGFGTLKYKTGAFFALCVGASGLSFLGIGSAFWALVAGVVVSAICDRKDFKTDSAVVEQAG